MTDDKLEHESTTEAMARLADERARASARIDQLERDSREATRALTAASDALVEFERRGGRAADRTKLERTLAEAKARATEPWRERIEGGRRAVRDATQAVQTFQAEHLSELVADLEAYGRGVAEQLDAAARALVQAHIERERVAGEISRLASSAGRVQPGDVTRSAGEGRARRSRPTPERWRATARTGSRSAPAAVRVRGGGVGVTEPAEHDDLAGLDVFTRGRIANAERKADLARALTGPESETNTEDFDQLVDLVADRVIEKLSEPRERESL